MQRYYYVVPVTKSNENRYFTFYIDAESREDADRRIKKEGEFQDEDVEVVSLSDLEFVDTEPARRSTQPPEHRTA